nr:IS66 family insertion sequence element accessory protein TnpB [Paraburkholderia terricola]
MGKAIDGLSYLVEPLLAQKPASGNPFVFVARDRSKVKVLYWDRTGFPLWYKRLERGRFPTKCSGSSNDVLTHRNGSP